MTAIVLALALLSSPAHAEWCSGIITSNGTCIGSGQHRSAGYRL
jgi:hypothetical protein